MPASRHIPDVVDEFLEDLPWIATAENSWMVGSLDLRKVAYARNGSARGLGLSVRWLRAELSGQRLKRLVRTRSVLGNCKSIQAKPAAQQQKKIP